MKEREWNIAAKGEQTKFEITNCILFSAVNSLTRIRLLLKEHNYVQRMNRKTVVGPKKNSGELAWAV